MLRIRFKIAEEDYRPIKFPPPYPYWCSGYDPDDKAILIAFADNLEQLYEYWPDAEEPDATEEDEIHYTDRFPKPDWYIHLKQEER